MGSGSIADRDYFKKILATRKSIISRPVASKETGNQVVAVASPVISGDKVIGLIGSTVKLSYLQQLIASMNINGQGYGWVISGDKRVIAHPNDDYLGNNKIIKDGGKGIEKIIDRMVNRQRGTENYYSGEGKRIVAFSPIENTDWSIAISVSSSRLNSPLRLLRYGSIGLGFVAIVIGLIITYIIADYVSKPVIKLSNITERIARGEFGQELSGFGDRNDEVGKLVKSVNEMAVSLQDMMGQVLEQKEELQASNEQLEAYNRELTVLNEELEASYQEVSDLAGNLKMLINFISELRKTSLEDEEKFLSDLLHTAFRLIPEADYGSIFIYGDKYIKFVDTIGHDLSVLQDLSIRRETFAMEREEISIVKDIVDFSYNNMDDDKKDRFLAASKDIKETITLDLSVEDRKIACISLDIARSSEKSFDDEAISVLESFRSLASAFFTVDNYNKLQRRFQKEIIISLTQMLEIHDKYTKGHSRNVAGMAREIAEKMGLSERKVNQAYWTGIVHDIGKILVPTSILNKKGALTEREYEEIKKHPYWGYATLNKSEELKEIALYVRDHHERWDGRGYPSGLRGKEIPLVARIISVADAWDAMLSDRSYRDALTREEALREIRDNCGTQFDPEVVEVFLEMRCKDSGGEK